MAATHPLLTRILLTNDDGVNAPGLKALEEIAAALSDDVWVVAPETEQSGAGHSLTLTQPLRIRKLGDRRFAIQGTPTDCVMLGLNHLMKDARPTLVLSGVNRGVNLADDVTYSGTIAGAMEGTLAGLPSVALSQAISPETRRADFSIARRHGAEIVRKLVTHGWSGNVFINVNFPAPVAGGAPDDAPGDAKGVKVTEQGKRDLGLLKIEERRDPRGFPYYWFGLSRRYGEPGHETDLKAVRDGWISVTPLHLDLTHFKTRDEMAPEIDESF
jgi:5'-nucleotidase